MPLASTSRVQLRGAIEATYGSVVASTLRRKVAMTGESLAYSTTFGASKGIRSDRMVSDVILLSVAAQGGFNFELMYKEYDDFLASGFQSAWVAFNATGMSPTIGTPTFTTTTLTQTAGTSFATIAKGQWFQIGGCTGATAGNNGLFQASLTVACTATVITIDTALWTAGAATGTVLLSTSRLTNGVTQISHNLEVEFNDIAQFLTFRGMTTSKLSLAVTAGAIVTGVLDFMGKDAMPLSATSNIVGTDDVNFPTVNSSLSATANVGQIMEGGVALSGTYLKSVTVDLDNALRAQMAIANLGNVGIGSGTIKLTGKMEAYFANATLFNKFINNTTSSISFRVVDDNVNLGTCKGYVFTVPALEFTSGTLTAGGLDQDMMVSLGFEAKIDALSGKMILIDRIGTA